MRRLASSVLKREACVAEADGAGVAQDCEVECSKSSSYESSTPVDRRLSTTRGASARLPAVVALEAPWAGATVAEAAAAVEKR